MLGRPLTRNDWFSAFLLLLFFGVVYKDDVDLIASHRWFNELSWPPFVHIFKENWALFIGAAAACGAIWLITQRKFAISRNRLAVLIVLLPFVAMCRGLLESQELGAKLSLAFVFATGLVFLAVMAAARLGKLEYGRRLAGALYCFAMAHVSVNLYLLASGHGYVPGNPRFFGTSAHPNFIGVQLGLCSIVLLSRIHSKKNLIPAIFLAASIGLQVLSGSRSGLLVLGTGMLVFIAGRQRFATTTLLTMVALAGVGGSIAWMYTPAELLLSFDRGTVGADTRSAAWATLASAIAARPILGHGLFTLATENSFLRGWANYGALYFIILLLTIVASTQKLLRLTRKSDYATVPRLLLSLHAGLIIGGIFEGYLVDSLALPVVIFFITSSFDIQFHRQRVEQQRVEPISASSRNYAR